MISNGSGRGTNYDDRFRTDGPIFVRSRVAFRDFTDGLSGSVVMSETIRGDGSDATLPSGVLPKFPYQKFLNGSAGISPSGPISGGYTGSGSGWPIGTVSNPDLQPVVIGHTNWRGGGAGSGRGFSWVRSLTANVTTNGYNTPNSVIPDITFHGSGYYGPRSFHGSGAHVVYGDGSVSLLHQSIDVSVHRSLHGINDGDVVMSNE